jgi:hypothetical protein
MGSATPTFFDRATAPFVILHDLVAADSPANAKSGGLPHRQSPSLGIA